MYADTPDPPTLNRANRISSIILIQTKCPMECEDVMKILGIENLRLCRKTMLQRGWNAG